MATKSSNSFSEKRKHPRLDQNVPVKICQEDGDIVTETANISRSGAYCKVDRYIEPMTKLKMHLLIPLKKGNKILTKTISCNGVVVRTESQGKDYNVAIFFNDITHRDAEAIADYVHYYMEQKQKAKI